MGTVVIINIICRMIENVAMIAGIISLMCNVTKEMYEIGMVKVLNSGRADNCPLEVVWHDHS